MTTKIVGGIIKEKEKPKAVNAVEVSWQWSNEAQGLITWTFKNTSDQKVSFALLRSGYYFGNAFYPVYEENPEFDTVFTTTNISLSPNTDSPPLAVVYFSGKPIVCFVFTLSPNQTWSMEEGGWSSEFTPSDYSAVPVTPSVVKKFSIQYNPEQVTQWDEQSGTDYKGWSPNPSQFTVMKYVSDGEYISIFSGESITPVSTNSNSNGFWNELEDGLEEIEKFLSTLFKF